MAWCIEDEAHPSTDRLLDSLKSGEALVPSLWPLEISNVLLMAERRGRLTRAQAFQCLEMLRALPIAVDESTSSRAMGDILSLARDQGLSVYDAAYLELSIREALPLATRDQVLATAAKRCGVPLTGERNRTVNDALAKELLSIRRRKLTERLRTHRKKGPAVGTEDIVAALRKDRENH